MNEPIEVLQSRLNELKAAKASLQADLLRARERPSTSQVKKAAKRGRKEISHTLQELSLKVVEVEERCILYRTAGWTVFEMELDIGKRQRNARKQATITSPHAKTSLGLGVRLETFHKGRFYEPFYLIFAKSAQLVQNEAKVLAPSLDEASRTPTSTSTQRSVRLMRHTIPHFIPLSEILHNYLQPDHVANDVEEEEEKIGGLQLLERLMTREGLHLFLSQLHAYLQSFVSRRQQAIALAELSLPGLAFSSLQAFGNDSFSQLNVRWDLPTPTQKDLQLFEQHGDILFSNRNERGSLEPAVNIKGQGTVNTSLEVSIVYHNLSSDRVGTLAKPLSARQQMIQALANDEVLGLKCTFATVLVETIRSRVPAPRRGESDKMEKLQIKRARRNDWELLFTQSHGSLPDLQTTLAAVLQLAWKEEMQRVSQ